MKFKFVSLLLVALQGLSPVWAEAPATVDVFKSPSCGCCGKWVQHLRQYGFQVVTHDLNDLRAVRKQLGMPDQLSACHTAKIGGYAVEGHVPAADIQRLLKEKPNALGLSVPSMPPGAPGMENPKPVPYQTLLVHADGTTQVFAQH